MDTLLALQTKDDWFLVVMTSNKITKHREIAGTGSTCKLLVTYPCKCANKTMDVLLWFLCIHRCTDVQHILNEHKCRNVTNESVIHLPEGPLTQAVFDVIFAAISTGFFVMPSAATPN